jgi:threonine/homoserine/homoserine lactone efflux protein
MTLPSALLIVLGLTLMAGAETHYNTVFMILQGLVGLFLLWFGIKIGKHEWTR